MTFYEKNYTLLIIASLLILLITVSQPDNALKINNLLILVFGAYMARRLKLKRNEIEKENNFQNKSNWFVRIFLKTDIMDEREKLIHLKTNNVSFIFALLVSYVIFFIMNELHFSEELKGTWFFYVMSGYMMCKGVTGLIYSRFLPIAY